MDTNFIQEIQYILLFDFLISSLIFFCYHLDILLETNILIYQIFLTILIEIQVVIPAPRSNLYM